MKERGDDRKECVFVTLCVLERSTTSGYRYIF